MRGSRPPRGLSCFDSLDRRSPFPAHNRCSTGSTAMPWYSGGTSLGVAPLWGGTSLGSLFTWHLSRLSRGRRPPRGLLPFGSNTPAVLAPADKALIERWRPARHRAPKTLPECGPCLLALLSQPVDHQLVASCSVHLAPTESRASIRDHNQLRGLTRRHGDRLGYPEGRNRHQQDAQHPRKHTLHAHTVLLVC